VEGIGDLEYVFCDDPAILKARTGTSIQIELTGVWSEI
jgi:hypothetical protein